MSADKSADDIENLSSRRQLLRQMAAVSLALPFPVWAQAPAQRTDRRRKEPAPLPPPTALSPEDDKFLDDLERSSFLFFWEQANPQTGLIKDRCNVHINDTGVVASIASTGFGLTAICIAEKRGYISHQEARLRVIATLVFLWRKLPTHRGFFYHSGKERSIVGIVEVIGEYRPDPTDESGKFGLVEVKAVADQLLKIGAAYGPIGTMGSTKDGRRRNR